MLDGQYLLEFPATPGLEGCSRTLGGPGADALPRNDSVQWGVLAVVPDQVDINLSTTYLAGFYCQVELREPGFLDNRLAPNVFPVCIHARLPQASGSMGQAKMIIPPSPPQSIPGFMILIIFESMICTSNSTVAVRHLNECSLNCNSELAISSVGHPEPPPRRTMKGKERTRAAEGRLHCVESRTEEPKMKTTMKLT